MSQMQQLPRACLAWMLLALVAVVIPHARHLPVWELVAISGVLFWRIQLHRGFWFLPGRWTKLLLAVLSVIGLRLQYGSLFAMEPMVGLLVISVMLKLLEMYRSRDAIIVVLLGFFIAATQFLFSQTFFDFLYGLLCFVLLVATLVSLAQGEGSRSTSKTLPLAAKLTVQCIPVMVVLFLLFPRFGSLWAVPLPQTSAQTGISDFMSPGDITNLSRNGGRAFTVTFEDQVPPNRDLYWRGLTLSYFDGRAWSPSQWGEYPENTQVHWQDFKKPEWRDQGVALSDPINYQVILEPTHRPWMFVLPLAEVNQEHTGITREFTLVHKDVVSNRVKYDAKSSLTYTIDQSELTGYSLKRNLRLPDNYNPQTLAIAEQWANTADSDKEVIERFLAMVQQDFVYTLQPPALGKHSVDEFLWQTKTGFCEHFASAFVIFMRAAGIPARVVTGYQGGEWIGNFLQVSQADAHAWAEVWLEGEGWVRVDPTSAVAPNRIESGIREVFSRPVDNLLSMEAYRHIGFLNRIRLQMDVWNYQWQRYVLNYNQEQQSNLITKLLGNINWLNAGLLLVGSVGGVLGLVALYLWLSNRPIKPAEEITLFNKFCKRCKANGHQKKTGESARAYIQRLGTIYPSKREHMYRILELFEQVSYLSDSQAVKDLRLEVERFYLPR